MPWQRSRPGGKSVNPLYRTAEHQQARARLLAAFTPGDPCCLCGRPMWQSKGLHADHLPGTTQYRGLAHPACNRRDGAVRARQRQTTTAQRM